MLKRSAFKRGEAVATVRPEKMAKWPEAPEQWSFIAIQMIAIEVKAQPKTIQHRNPTLLGMARGQPCLMRVPGTCRNNPETTVAAHSNWAMHGKAKSRKANDQYHVYACAACHHWLDQGGAPAKEKQARFMAAHICMVNIWRDIALGFQDATPKDRVAAQWALDRLGATPGFSIENAP